MTMLRSVWGRVCRGLDRSLGAFVILIFAVLVVDVLWGVVSRYVLGSQARWTEELATNLLVWVSLLGAALAYAEGAHIGVDVLVRKLDPGAQHLAAMVAHVAAATFAILVMIGGGYVLVSETLAAGQTTPALGWKMGHIYLSVPLSGAAMLIFAIGHLLGLNPATGEPVANAPTAPATL